MRRYPGCLFVAVALGLVGPAWSACAAAEPADIAGTWELSWVQFGATNLQRIDLHTSGEQISGKGLWNLAVEGTRAKEGIEFKLLGSDKKTVATLTGTIQPGRLAGTMKLDTDEFIDA